MASGSIAGVSPAFSLAEVLLSDSRSLWPCVGYVLGTETVCVVKDHSAWPEPDDMPLPEVVKKEHWGTGEVGRNNSKWKMMLPLPKCGKTCWANKSNRGRQSEQGLVIS